MLLWSYTHSASVAVSHFDSSLSNGRREIPWLSYIRQIHIIRVHESVIIAHLTLTLADIVQVQASRCEASAGRAPKAVGEAGEADPRGSVRIEFEATRKRAALRAKADRESVTGLRISSLINRETGLLGALVTPGSLEIVGRNERVTIRRAIIVRGTTVCAARDEASGEQCESDDSEVRKGNGHEADFLLVLSEAHMY
jgi:hypothetical protein